MSSAAMAMYAAMRSPHVPLSRGFQFIAKGRHMNEAARMVIKVQQMQYPRTGKAESGGFGQFVRADGQKSTRRGNLPNILNFLVKKMRRRSRTMELLIIPSDVAKKNCITVSDW